MLWSFLCYYIFVLDMTSVVVHLVDGQIVDHHGLNFSSIIVPSHMPILVPLFVPTRCQFYNRFIAMNTAGIYLT